VGVWSGLANGVGQPAGARQQPPGPLVGGLGVPEVVGLVVGDGLGGSPLDDDGGPAVAEADVLGELGQRPGRQVGTGWAGSASRTAAANLAVSAWSSVS
jgi:hypothetical protein